MHCKTQRIKILYVYGYLFSLILIQNLVLQAGRFERFMKETGRVERDRWGREKSIWFPGTSVFWNLHTNSCPKI